MYVCMYVCMYIVCHPVLCCPILSYPVLPYPILSYPLLSSPLLSSPLLSYPILSSPILSYPILSCPVLSSPILSYPLLSYPISKISVLPAHRPSHPPAFLSFIFWCETCPPIQSSPVQSSPVQTLPSPLFKFKQKQKNPPKEKGKKGWHHSREERETTRRGAAGDSERAKRTGRKIQSSTRVNKREAFFPHPPAEKKGVSEKDHRPQTLVRTTRREHFHNNIYSHFSNSLAD